MILRIIVRVCMFCATRIAARHMPWDCEVLRSAYLSAGLFFFFVSSSNLSFFTYFCFHIFFYLCKQLIAIIGVFFILGWIAGI